MKTAIQKTDGLLNELLSCDFRTNVGVDKAKRLIRVAIKEQDRDTRHSCAEAISNSLKDSTGEYVYKDAAYNACMNAKAV